MHFVHFVHFVHTHVIYAGFMRLKALSPKSARRSSYDHPCQSNQLPKVAERKKEAL